MYICILYLCILVPSTPKHVSARVISNNFLWWLLISYSKFYKTFWFFMRNISVNLYKTICSFLHISFIWHAPWENMSQVGCMRIAKDQSSLRIHQSDQGLHCSLTDLLNTTELMLNVEQKPGWYFAHAQDDLNPRIQRIFEGTFAFDAAHLFFLLTIQSLTVQNIYFCLFFFHFS